MRRTAVTRKALLRKPDDDDRLADPREARKKAMDYLARREYGRNELERKLIAAGFESVAAVDAVAVLADEGLQDDRRYVENFIQSRINQGKGPQRIHADLGQKGLATGLIDDMLDAADVDWSALARAQRTKKFGSAIPTEFKEKARQMRFLQYRGFEQRHIHAALAAADADW